MEKIVTYIIKEETAKAIRKILSKISDINMRGDYNLTAEELLEVHNYLDELDIE